MFAAYLRTVERSCPPDDLELCGVERLERRQMLAGQVTVLVNGNNVRLRGDGAANDVELGIVNGQIEVTGNNTTVNGGATGVAANSLGSLSVQLRGGDDTFHILPDVNINGNLTIRTAGGTDFVRLRGNHTVRGDAIIQTGGAQDFFYAADVTFEGNFRLVTGGGGDFVYLGGAESNITFDGTVNVSMGGGSDAFNLDDFTTFTFNAANNRLNGGGGFDNVFPLTNSFLAAYPNFTIRSFEF